MDKYTEQTIFPNRWDSNGNLHPPLEKGKYIIAFDKDDDSENKGFFPVDGLKELSRMVKSMPGKDKILYEYRPTPRCRLFIDVTCKETDDEEFFTDICNVIIYNLNYAWDYNPVFKKEDLYIYSSTMDGKINYHFVVGKYYVDDIRFMKNLIWGMNREINLAYPGCGNIYNSKAYGEYGYLQLLHNRKKGFSNKKRALSTQDDVNTFKAGMITHITQGKYKINPKGNCTGMRKSAWDVIDMSTYVWK